MEERGVHIQALIFFFSSYVSRAFALQTTMSALITQKQRKKQRGQKRLEKKGELGAMHSEFYGESISWFRCFNEMRIQSKRKKVTRWSSLMNITVISIEPLFLFLVFFFLPSDNMVLDSRSHFESVWSSSVMMSASHRDETALLPSQQPWNILHLKHFWCIHIDI